MHNRAHLHLLDKNHTEIRYPRSSGWRAVDSVTGADCCSALSLKGNCIAEHSPDDSDSKLVKKFLTLIEVFQIKVLFRGFMRRLINILMCPNIAINTLITVKFRLGKK